MRTEEDKIFQSEISIILGGNEYLIKPLVIKEARKWRTKFAKLIGELPGYSAVTTDTPDKFMEAIEKLIVAVPDKIIELVCDYAGLEISDVEGYATEDEIGKAFEKILEVALPLAKSLVGAMSKLA